MEDDGWGIIQLCIIKGLQVMFKQKLLTFFKIPFAYTLQEMPLIPAPPLAATEGISGDIQYTRLVSPLIPAVAAKGDAGIAMSAIRVLLNLSRR